MKHHVDSRGEREVEVDGGDVCQIFITLTIMVLFCNFGRRTSIDIVLHSY